MSSDSQYIPTLWLTRAISFFFFFLVLALFSFFFSPLLLPPFATVETCRRFFCLIYLFPSVTEPCENWNDILSLASFTINCMAGGDKLYMSQIACVSQISTEILSSSSSIFHSNILIFSFFFSSLSFLIGDLDGFGGRSVRERAGHKAKRVWNSFLPKPHVPLSRLRTGRKCQHESAAQFNHDMKFEWKSSRFFLDRRKIGYFLSTCCYQSTYLHIKRYDHFWISSK